MNLPSMSTTEKPTPPVDVIHEDSGPALSAMQEHQDKSGVDIDDAQIEEPKDQAFKKNVGPETPPKRRRKRA
jgi:hypothetical protein